MTINGRKRGDTYSFLPVREPETVATRKAVKGLRSKWAGHSSMRRADADDAPDQVQFIGFLATRHDIAAAPTGCHDCGLRSDSCDRCDLLNEDENDSNEFSDAFTALIGILVARPKPKTANKPVFQVQYLYTDIEIDAYERYGEHLPAPMARGARALLGRRCSGQMFS